MKLREWDWDKQAFVEVDYPDAPIVQFMNWLRHTKAWHEDVELVHRKVLYLNKGFAEHRQAQVEALALTARNVTASPAPVEPTRAEVNRANLAKARAAKAARRAAGGGGTDASDT